MSLELKTDFLFSAENCFEFHKNNYPTPFIPVFKKNEATDKC